jgi:hypothetical protein
MSLIPEVETTPHYTIPSTGALKSMFVAGSKGQREAAVRGILIEDRRDG